MVIAKLRVAKNEFLNTRPHLCLGSAIFSLLWISLVGVTWADGDDTQGQLLPQIRSFADNLLEHGRDHYGSKHSPLFVSQLDIDTRRIPPADTRLYGRGHRGGAGPTTSNLQFDSGLVRLLDALSQVTGDARYSKAVDDYLAYYFAELPDPATGFFPWGDHRGYDVVNEQTLKGYHEFKVIFPPWDRYYRTNPGTVTRLIESLRLHIYDESRSWAFSRHHPSGGEVPHSMNSSGGAWIAAWSFLYKQTDDPRYLKWAETMADYFWSIRDPHTDLLAAHPADPAYPLAMQNEMARKRASRTEYMGQLAWFAPNLLRAAELVGSEKGGKFRQQAMAYIRAFTVRMDIDPDGSFYPTFELKTGKPLFPRITDVWSFVSQQDERYPWGNRVLGIRAPIALAYAYKTTGEADLKEAFDKLLPLYRVEEFAKPAAPRKELPAGLIGQAITSFLHMYQATDERRYLTLAEDVGRYAVKHYLVDGWCVCGPPLLERYSDGRVNAWRLYSNRGGSAELALALIRLHLALTGKDDSIEDNPMCYF